MTLSPSLRAALSERERLLRDHARTAGGFNNYRYTSKAEADESLREADEIAALIEAASRHPPVCKLCGGRGEIGGSVGQTAETFEWVTEACPDCEAARHSQPGAEGGEGRDDFMDGCIAGYVREAAKRVTGGNMTFADDDIRVLEVLAVRAVRAGLTDNLHPDVAATAVEACATHPLPDEASPQQPATSTDEKVGDNA